MLKHLNRAKKTQHRNNGSIYFYDPDLKYGWLASFSKHAFHLDGEVWPTVEHFYQSQKFKGTRLEEIIRSSPTSRKAKELAKHFRTKRPSNWNRIKRKVMYKAIKAKFAQNKKLKALLLSTGDRKIIENTTNDFYWGCGINKKGKNVMGILLMKLRHELRNESKYE